MSRRTSPDAFSRVGDSVRVESRPCYVARTGPCLCMGAYLGPGVRNPDAGTTLRKPDESSRFGRNIYPTGTTMS